MNNTGRADVRFGEQELKKAQYATQAQSDPDPQYRGGGALCGGAIGRASEQPRDREIPEKIGILFNLADRLEGNLSRLTSRLVPVMAIRPSDAEKACPQPASTEFGSQLAALAARLASAGDLLELLQAQLEL